MGRRQSRWPRARPRGHRGSGRSPPQRGRNRPGHAAVKASVPVRVRRWLWAGWGCACLMAATVRPAGAETLRRYDLAGGEAAAVLEEFAEAANVQLLFPARAVRGVRLPELHGELSARDALDRLLADSGLEAVRDDDMGGFAVRRSVRAPTAPDPKRVPAA